MGDDVLPPNGPAGNDCPVCTGPGKTWAAGETPNFLYCRFWGIVTEDRPECNVIIPQGTVHILPQTANPCLWLKDFGVDPFFFRIQYKTTNEPKSYLSLFLLTLPIFSSSVNTSCAFSFSNGVPGPPNCYHSGQGQVWWASMPSKMAYTYGLAPVSGSMSEEEPAKDGNQWMCLANYKTPMSIQIVADPQPV